MSGSKNPFHVWLGLKPNVTNPHHFQLLGVSTQMTDQSAIEKAVAEGVKRNLALLAQVPPGKFDSAVEKIKQRIAVAQNTLLDPASRQAYKAKLMGQSSRAKPAPANSDLLPPGASQKRNDPKPLSAQPPLAPGRRTPQPPNSPATPSSTPTLPPKAPSANRPIANPIASNNIPPAQPPAAPVANPAVPPAQPIASSNANANTVPSAIPIAAPLNSTNPASPTAHAMPVAPTTPVAPAVPVVASMPVAPGTPVEMSNEAVTGSVSIDRKVGRRKKSRVLAPLMMLIMLGSGAVGAFFIYQNFDSLTAAFSGKPIVANPVKEPEEESPPPKKLQKVDINKIPELDVDEVMANSSNVTGRTPEQEEMLKNMIEADGETDVDPNATDPTGLVGGPPEVDNGNDPNEMASTPENIEPPTTPDETEKPKTVEEPVVKIVALDAAQLARFRRNLSRAHRQIYRRDHVSAKKSISLTADIANQVLTSDSDQFEGEQKEFVQNISDSMAVMELIEGFWQQVGASADKISGAQEIVVGTQIVAFVESLPGSVIIRRSGTSIEYGYGFCPPGLAVAIAEQAAVPDVPTWNKQKAAFYAIDQLGGLDHSGRINEFLKIAEDANHDCDAIRRFAKFDFGTSGLPEEKIQMPRGSKADPAIEGFRQEVGYKRIKTLDPATALKSVETLLQIDSPNFQQQAALLEEARQLAIRAGDAGLVEDAVIELGHYALIKQSELMCESFSKVANEKLNANQTRVLMERAIGFLNSNEADEASPKERQILIGRLAKLANNFFMPDALRRLQQIKF